MLAHMIWNVLWFLCQERWCESRCRAKSAWYWVYFCQKEKDKEFYRAGSPLKASKNRLGWRMELSRYWKNYLHEYTCCKKLKWYQHCNTDFIREMVNLIARLSQTSRKVFLGQSLTSTCRCQLDGQTICSNSPIKDFHFSSDIEVSVKASQISGLHTSLTTKDAGLKTEAQDWQQDVPNSQAFPIAAECVVCFLRRQATERAANIPHKDEIHLPFQICNEF